MRGMRGITPQKEEEGGGDVTSTVNKLTLEGHGAHGFSTQALAVKHVLEVAKVLPVLTHIHGHTYTYNIPRMGSIWVPVGFTDPYVSI